MIRIEDRLDMLERTLTELLELNKTMPVVVEGKRDVAALRELGITGDILVVHDGRPLIDLSDRLAAEHKEVVILTDWDRTGGTILRHLVDNLKGRVRTHREIRKNLAIYSEVRDVESLPAYLNTLRKKVNLATRENRDGAHPRH